MQLVFSLAVLVVVVSPQAQKDKFDQKAVNLGITFFNKAEIGKMTSCMEPSFYNTETMDQMKPKGVKCVMGACNIIKMGKAVGILGKMDKCLKPTGQNTMKFAEKLFPNAKKAVKLVYDEVKKAITTAKKNNKPKQFVVNKGYEKLNAAVTKNLINNVCLTLRKNINETEWNCVKTVGKEVVNFDGYPCANN